MALSTCACQRLANWLPTLLSGPTYSGLEIYQYGTWYVSGVITLVVEYVFAVAAFGREVFEITILADSVLLAELLPELASNCDVVSSHTPWFTRNHLSPSRAPEKCLHHQEALGLRSTSDASSEEALTVVAALPGLDRDNFPADSVRGAKLQRYARHEIYLGIVIGFSLGVGVSCGGQVARG